MALVDRIVHGREADHPKDVTKLAAVDHAPVTKTPTAGTAMSEDIELPVLWT